MAGFGCVDAMPKLTCSRDFTVDTNCTVSVCICCDVYGIYVIRDYKATSVTISTLTQHSTSWSTTGSICCSNLSVGVRGVTGLRASPDPAIRVPGLGNGGRSTDVGVPINFAMRGLTLL